MNERPLFVPLKTEWFRAFEDGTKTVEYRRHGRGWTETNCYPGRAVTLSHGYNGDRLRAVVVSTQLVQARDVPNAIDIYKPGETLIAIRLRLINPVNRR